MTVDVLELLPLGNVDLDLLLRLGNGLSKNLPVVTAIEKSVDMPKNVFDPKRNQYHSTKILKDIYPDQKKQDKLLAISDCDLYIEEMNFVFGESDYKRGRAIISLARLQQAFYDLPDDPDLFFHRTLKEAIHELGHLYNLPHCANHYCVMHFSNSLKATDRKSHRFCLNCRNLLPG